jgi:hypothetical protein
VQQKQVRERLQRRLLILSALGSDGQAFPRVLVNDGQHAERSAIVGSVHDEVHTQQTWIAFVSFSDGLADQRLRMKTLRPWTRFDHFFPTL